MPGVYRVSRPCSRMSYLQGGKVWMMAVDRMDLELLRSSKCYCYENIFLLGLERVPRAISDEQTQNSHLCCLLHKFIYLCVKKHSTETEYHAKFSLKSYTDTRKTTTNFIGTNNVQRSISTIHVVFGVLSSV